MPNDASDFEPKSKSDFESLRKTKEILAELAKNSISSSIQTAFRDTSDNKEENDA